MAVRRVDGLEPDVSTRLVHKNRGDDHIVSTSKSTPREAEAWNIRLIGHSDLNGYGDGMQLMLKENYLGSIWETRRCKK